MTSTPGRLAIAFKALFQLGPGPLAQYAWYRLGLHTGLLRWQTAHPARPAPPRLAALITPPPLEAMQAALGSPGAALLQTEAEEILASRFRMFGGPPAPLSLAPAPPLPHWTAVRESAGDIKLTWEPARFGWAFTLARAYRLGMDERFALAFWERLEQFLDANPPYYGPHWISAQEAALRILAWSFAWSVFQDSPHATPARAARLAQAVADHAARIPPTLAYARAQHNNHLLSEAAGLYTAGLALPAHPQAARWRELGLRWFQAGLRDQIDPDGVYTQHSANYQRLMLQLGVWVDGLAARQGQALEETASRRLQAATAWLGALVDPLNGRTPNLGPNDGAYILPLSACPFADYRPALQAAAAAFLGQPAAFGPGPWDELRLWLLPAEPRPPQSAEPRPAGSPAVLRLADRPAWGYLRAARFRSRPGHADQLHLDLWWRGHNLAQDAGTYHYNALPPWENALTAAAVHNTVTVADQDQMLRAGRFLYLDPAQAELLVCDGPQPGGWRRLAARQAGYRRLGVIHSRQVQALPGGRILVEDELAPSGQAAGERLARLHWLLPDWPWELRNLPDETAFELRLRAPEGDHVLLRVSAQAAGDIPARLQLSRAGQTLVGESPARPTAGWVSPTYSQRLPALALALEIAAGLPIRFTSLWRLPPEPSTRDLE